MKQFPFDKLKIDQSFIHRAENSSDSRAIIRAVIGLGKSLGMPIVAEGVQTASQLDLLTRESCDEVQGYLIGRPMPADRIDAFLATVGLAKVDHHADGAGPATALQAPLGAAGTPLRAVAGLSQPLTAPSVRPRTM